MSGRQEDYSGLEVHHDPTTFSRPQSPYHQDPEFVPTKSPPPHTSPSQPSDWSYRDSEATKFERYPEPYGETSEPKRSQNICGLRPVTFWILVALIFLICAGAIGGGVGGSLAVQSSKSAADSVTRKPR